LRSAPVFATPGPEAAAQALPEEERTLIESRRCYICKVHFKTVHAFYDRMCGACGDFNYAKRTQTAELRGRTALITGARVKIGYQASILLLRAGARVLVTTRFPRDAALRYAREADYESFRHRLVIHGLDLRHTPSVETFCKQLIETEERLDYLLHNACQTVRRPSGFYAHLMEGERVPVHELPPEARSTLAPRPVAVAHEAVGLTRAPELSQVALLAEDALRGGAIFPDGALDADLQQIDRRLQNSWRLTLSEVPTVELLEVQLVNAVAPFVMNARLKPLLTRTPERDKHIVNVSAMEGQFYRAYKTDRHPHTYMAKAALNMMTRTSAPDYVKDGVHMNSVDTGWVTDEDAAHIADRKAEELGFSPPLDIVDGAARIVDPIFHGANTGEQLYGLFLKDYRPVPW
jgi:NAD(P)-dependent dehydrogenase (short-subunit alcohol dehydrogenase family)